MTYDDRVTRVLTDWLEEQPNHAPDQLLNSFLNDLQSAPQRARWQHALRRFPLFTSNNARYLAVAAVGVLAVVIGLGLWAGRGGGLGGPGATPSLAPTAGPTASPIPTPS